MVLSKFCSVSAIVFILPPTIGESHEPIFGFAGSGKLARLAIGKRPSGRTEHGGSKGQGHDEGDRLVALPPPRLQAPVTDGGAR